MPAPYKRIVLISSGQPSVNPRLVKEADALAAAGYQVTVLYQYWNEWATRYDKKLLATKKWDSFRVAGAPDEQRALYNRSRIIHKLSIVAAKKLGFNNGLAERALGRCTSLLTKEAFKHSADIYIAHNLAALPAAVKAAKNNHAKCGFDAEDYHRNEASNDARDFDVRLKTFIEQKYIPQTDYLTAASEAIAAQYETIFPPQKVLTIINAFPKTKLQPGAAYQAGEILKLLWFSQTIGADRGIEDIISAMGKLNGPVQLHLLGNCTSVEKSRLLALANDLGLQQDQLQFHAPVHPDELFSFASQFHIGIASETGSPLNRDLCLTNKIFTYLQCGLATVASDTQAQAAFLAAYPALGKLYPKGDPLGLAACIESYLDDPQLLAATRQAAYLAGQHELNWEFESEKFLALIKKTLDS